MIRRFSTGIGVIAAVLGLSGSAAPPSYAANAPDVTFSTVSLNGYGTDDLNACGIIRDNLITVGNYQYITYYGYTSNTNAPLYVARRLATDNSPTAWTTVLTPYSDVVGVDSVGTDGIITNGIDDHDDSALAIDGNGNMHLSWGMHNVTLNYSISNAPVNGSTFNPIFTQLSTTTSTVVPGNSSSATYPEFYYERNSAGALTGNLLFEYRQGEAGNGNQYFTTYNSATRQFQNDEQVLNGSNNTNAYPNSLVYDSNGNLLASWTWRGTTGYESNSGMYFAQSSNNGVTWTKQGGSTYALPISSSSNPQQPVALAQGTSLINATTMTVDVNNNPLIATWDTPLGQIASNNKSTPTDPPGSGNPNRQYELLYYTGSQWKTSQITNRTSDLAFDGAASAVRDLARPLVLVDKENRVLVVTRSEDSGGLVSGAISPSLAGNDIVVYWNTMASLDSNSPSPWQSVVLDTANMGEWEPDYDSLAWSNNNQLELVYQAGGLTGETSSAISVLQWDEPAYFASVPEPTLGCTSVLCLCLIGLRRRTSLKGAAHEGYSRSKRC